jgi:hypothetical protein
MSNDTTSKIQVPECVNLPEFYKISLDDYRGSGHPAMNGIILENMFKSLDKHKEKFADQLNEKYFLEKGCKYQFCAIMDTNYNHISIQVSTSKENGEYGSPHSFLDADRVAITKY